MAIRGPGGRPDGVPPPSLTSSPTTATTTASPIGRLIQFGAAQTPQEAKKLLGELLALLAAAGFPVPKTGNADQQLQSQLRQFQQQSNLPVTGRLDDATMRALGEQGLLPGAHDTVADQGPQRADSGRLQDRIELGLPRPALGGDPRLGGEKASRSPAPRAGDGAPGQSTRSVETEAAAARVAHGASDVEVDLKSMLNALKSAGFVGVGKGKEQLTDAVKKLQRVDGLPATGKLDAKTAESLERRGVLDPATAQALKEQDPAWTAKQAQDAQASSSSASTTSTASDGARGDQAAAGRDAAASANAAGAAAGEHIPTSVDGQQAPRDLRAGGSGDGDRGVDDGQGNNYAGDDDLDDDDRGAANRDDSDDPEMGRHWQVPPMREQVQTALVRIHRDDDGHGPATYGWELLLHRPGIYAAKQPAEEVLKLVVSAAGPFDPVWRQALGALNERLRRFDDDADPITFDVVERALQRARYRRDDGGVVGSELLRRQAKKDQNEFAARQRRVTTNSPPSEEA